MNEQTGSPTQDRSRSRAHLIARINRYKTILLKKWWLPLLAVIIGLAIEASLSWYDPPSYVSVGRMIVSIKLTVQEASGYTEELSNFLGTQVGLMQSGAVVNRAHARVTAQKPDLQMQPVTLRVSVRPKTTIFDLQAIGSDPKYTQAFLQACMEEFATLKKEMRTQTSDTTVAGLTEEVLRLEKELRKCDEELVAFQSTNSVSMIQDQGNSAGSYLATLQTSLATMKSEYDLLRMLTLDQTLEHQQEKAQVAATTGDPANKLAADTGSEPSSEYLKARQQILLAKATLQELSQDLRPKHPRIIAKKEEIAHLEQQLEIFKQQSVEQLDSRKSSLAFQIQNREKDIKDQEGKVLEVNRKTAEYQRIKSNSQRIQALYDKLLDTMQKLDVTEKASPESVAIMEKASTAFADKPQRAKQLLTGAMVGLGLSLVLLVLLDRLDDRMNSFTELQDLFDEPILGQIPREKHPSRKTELELISPEDSRHSFVEAYRNLRSSLLYMTEPSQRPKTLLLTSSVPNEGKSVTSSNLAITMASAGSRVLLVDADLRKGVLHNRFGTPAEPGLTEALSQGMNWTETVQQTKYPNLFLLPRGAVTHKSSEFFIGEVTEKFLKEVSAKFDYVLLDTAPVMAADDVTSLAPIIDGVVFLIRAEHTSARVARAALDLLYQRQVRLLGLIFNAVRPSSVDYYYYYKYKDYYKPYPTAAPGAKAAKTSVE